jgi:hypothetical protein
MDPFALARLACTRAAFSTLLLVAATGAHAADEYLARFAGDWVGQGTVRRADAAPEAVYCRLSAQLTGDGNTLLQSGRCAAGDEATPVSALLVYDPARRTVSGTFQGGRRGPAEISGERRDSRLLIRLRYTTAADQGAEAQIAFEPLAANRYRMSVTGSDGRGEIDFRRR